MSELYRPKAFSSFLLPPLLVWQFERSLFRPLRSSCLFPFSLVFSTSFITTGNVAFWNHAYELHCRHRPQILIIVEHRIAEKQAQMVIDTLPYTHSRGVDPTSFSGGIWMLWNESGSLKLEILTYNEYSIHALIKVPSSSLSFFLTTILYFS